MIHLSPPAASEIRRLLSKQRQPNMLFRVQVKTGGCSGLFYDIAFDEAVLGDQVYDCNGIPVVVDAQSLNYIFLGLTLDYSEDLMGGGFRFHNPNAAQICGCGNSFSANGDRI